MKFIHTDPELEEIRSHLQLYHQLEKLGDTELAQLLLVRTRQKMELRELKRKSIASFDRG